jgi:hypothetical protein
MIKWFLFQEYSFETEKNLQDDLDRLEAESIISPDNTINQEKTLEVTEMTRKKLSIKIQVWFCFCNTAIIMFGVFLLGNIIVWANYPLTNEVAKGYSNATVHPSKNKGNAKRGVSPRIKIWPPVTLKINKVPDSLKD